MLLLAADGRYLQATPDPAGLIYLNHTPITVVSRETKYSTPFGFGNQSIGRFTGSDVWQATPFVAVNNRLSYMYRNLSILRNGDGGSVVGNSLTGRQLRNQHDVVNDFDYEGDLSGAFVPAMSTTPCSPVLKYSTSLRWQIDPLPTCRTLPISLLQWCRGFKGGARLPAGRKRTRVS